MKRPRNFETDYLTGKDAAARLRELANHIEDAQYAYWSATIHYWNKGWEKPAFPLEYPLTLSVTYSSPKKRKSA